MINFDDNSKMKFVCVLMVFLGVFIRESLCQDIKVVERAPSNPGDNEPNFITRKQFIIIIIIRIIIKNIIVIKILFTI